MKKPSERINQIAGEMYAKIKSNTPYEEFEKTQIQTKAIIEFLDKLLAEAVTKGIWDEMTPDEKIVTKSLSSDFEVQYNAGWNDLFNKILQIKNKHFPEHIDHNYLLPKEFNDKLRALWAEFKELKK